MTMTTRTWIPSFLKPVIRFVYYKQERAKVFREMKLRKIQNTKLRQYDARTRKLIIFMIQGADYDTGRDTISGGIISIVSLCQESKKLTDVHQAAVIMCTFPDQYLLIKHTQFENETDVFRYAQLEPYFDQLQEVLIHVPEYMCATFNSLYQNGKFEWLKKMGTVRVNILNQNIRLMPAVSEIDQLKKYVHQVTSTTAHQRYCTPYYRALYNVPLHKFSVWISPEKYSFKSYHEKENLIVVSPDRHPAKEKVLARLSAIPGLQIQIIQNLTYEKYKETIARAKWSLTFGEGLDGYLIEPIFSGAIGFAVYNEEFFTPDFEGMQTIYRSMDELLEKIVADISRLDDSSEFESYQQKQFTLCARYYSQEEYRRNIVAFYRKEYTYA